MQTKFRWIKATLIHLECLLTVTLHFFPTRLRHAAEPSFSKKGPHPDLDGLRKLDSALKRSDTAAELGTCQKCKLLGPPSQGVGPGTPYFNKPCREFLGAENHCLAELEEPVDHAHSGRDFDVASTLSPYFRDQSQSQERRGLTHMEHLLVCRDHAGYLPYCT